MRHVTGKHLNITPSRSVSPWIPSLWASCLLLAFILLAGTGSAQAAAPLSHRLEIQLTPQEHILAGQDILRARLEGSELSFGLHPGLKIKEFHVQGVDLTKALREKERGIHLVIYTVPLPARLRDREVDLRFVYAGQIYHPVQKSQDLAFVAGDFTSGLIGEEGIFLPGEGSWYPRLADSRGHLSTFDLKARIADPWRLVSQGERVSQEIHGGMVTVRFSSPIPTDGLALVGGKYVVRSRVVDGITISTYFFPEEDALSELFLEKAATYLQTFSALLIPYPYKKFDIVENFFTTGYGMPTYTLLGRDVVKRGQMALQPGYLDHEIVHSWWGNYVYYEGAWGNWCEGLTTYYANYYTKERQDPDEARLHRMISAQKYSIRVDPAKDYPLRKFAGKEEGFEDDIGYGKSSMVFHQLRRMAGDERFFQTMRQILRDYGGKIARWEDFQQAFEKTLGRDLGWFFRQWLDRPGLPQLSLSRISWEAKGDHYRVTGQIRQRGEPYRLSLPLVLQAAGEQRELTVEVQDEVTPFEIEIPGPPQKLSLDPDYHLIRRLAPQDIPACLQATLQDQARLFVYPARGPQETVAIYQMLAQRATQAEGGKALPDDQVTEEMLRSRSLFLLGGPGENRVTQRVLEQLRTGEGNPAPADPAGFTASPSAFALPGKEYTAPSDSLLVSFRHPWNPARRVTLYYGLSPQALERAQYLFFYGWYGYVAFQQGRPAQRGYFPAQASETIYRFPGDRPPTPAGAHRPPEASPTTERLRAHLDYLASEALGGRYPGTPEDQQAARYLARQMVQMGLTPYARSAVRNGPEPSSALKSEEGYLQPFRLQVTDEEIEKLLLRSKARGQGTPARPLLDLVRNGVETYNIIGYLEGSDPRLKDELVILGAHYDHLGRNDAGEAFRGAVDNASGVAVLLEVAAALAAQAPRPKRSLLFIAFGAEEWGLRGSYHFVETLPPQVKVHTMINLDSLGSGKAEEFYLLGGSYFPHLSALALQQSQPLGLQLGKNIDVHGFKSGSDHYPFYEKGWAAVDLFAADYRALHQITDRPESVNMEQLQRLGRVVLGMVQKLVE
ncbi:MAG: M20/M25/M40 family metallo-hydrolase [Candidatus Tectomicrobia bacterium]|uniref:M20/M25/M40 family metallo-hydrolase n=1 Tax=Tectimicrobiota bacterium TaxID=2528274 RepID=A0A932CRH3_UNCTE|nr:M20/M25/M40 family metallo-hydrolase [Candidatus Tectomicrobia bacterium]